MFLIYICEKLLILKYKNNTSYDLICILEYIEQCEFQRFLIRLVITKLVLFMNAGNLDIMILSFENNIEYRREHMCLKIKCLMVYHIRFIKFFNTNDYKI